MTTRLAAVLSFFVSTLALAQDSEPPSSGPTLTGTFSVINNGPGNQTNPHVACDLASYTNVDDITGASTIHYWDFAASADHVVPGNGIDLLSDVSSSRIAFTEVTAGGDTVSFFDANTLFRTDIPGTGRSNPVLGGNLVVFEDRSYLIPPNQSEIGIYDLNTNTDIRLTNDTAFDKNPSVSPSGNAVVWEKCQTDGSNCDVYSAIQTAPGTFTTHLLSIGTGNDRQPDTNGTIAVYVSDKSGENDVYYQPVAGGTETHLSIAGDQRDVAISGNLIAFESNAGGSGYDIYVYDLAANTLYRVTNTPGTDETLTDISVCGSTGRIVYVVPNNGAFDVWAFTFTPPPPPPPPPSCEPAADACEDPTGRTLLATLTLTRGTGAPQSQTGTFADSEPGALICIRNHRATSGEVTINDQRVVGPSAFKHSVNLIALRVNGMQAVNSLEASIAGEKGTSYEVKIYSDRANCTACTRGAAKPTSEDAQLIKGERLTTADRFTQLSYDLDEPLEADAMGCSSTSGLALSGLAVLALWLTLRRRPAVARARRP
jgi:Tol biopolymer transport system component